MNDRIAAIKYQLAALEPVSLSIVDESHKHVGHVGSRNGGGHYVLNIVSAQFAGKNTTARHRMVYSALGELMKQEIHALTLMTKAPNEL